MSDLTPDVQAALDNLRTVNWDYLGAGELADAEQLVVERIQSAYRSALAGELYGDSVTNAVQGVCDELGYGNWSKSEILSIVKAAAPILRAPLLVQLQDKNERIKELEGKLDNERRAHSKSLHLVGDTMERVCKLGKRVESREEGNWGTRVVVTRQGDLYMMRDEVYRALQWPIPEVSSFHAEVP